ncbi:MAG: hypothetical protein Q3X94_03785 [Oscillospiraceae bacterium]|nr:hypothetical protein [Oscillospiraceae bacterium]
MKSLDQKQQQREENHAQKTHGAVPQVHGQQGTKRRQSRLIGHELGLHEAAHQRDHPIEGQKPNASENVIRQQTDNGPRDQSCSRAQNGQRIHQGDEEGQQQGVVRSQQEKADQQLREGQKGQKQLGLAPPTQGAVDVAAHAQGRLAQALGQLTQQKGADVGIAAGGVIDGQDSGDEKQSDAGELGGKGGHLPQHAGGEVTGGLCPLLGQGVAEALYPKLQFPGTGGAEALGPLLDPVHQSGQSAQQSRQLVQKGVSLLKQAGEQPKDAENQGGRQQQGENG